MLTSLLFTLLMSESPCSNLLFGEGELSLGRYTFAESVVSILSLPSFYPLVLSVKEIQNLPASRISTGFCFNHQPLFSLKTSGLVTCKYRESLEPFLVRVSARSSQHWYLLGTDYFHKLRENSLASRTLTYVSLFIVLTSLFQCE